MYEYMKCQYLVPSVTKLESSSVLRHPPGALNVRVESSYRSDHVGIHTTQLDYFNKLNHSIHMSKDVDIFPQIVPNRELLSEICG